VCLSVRRLARAHCVEYGMTMAERTQKQRSAPTQTPKVADDVEPSSESAEKVKANLDDLLDEIDEVLETNAEEFVRNYVQKGGE